MFQLNHRLDKDDTTKGCWMNSEIPMLKSKRKLNLLLIDTEVSEMTICINQPINVLPEKSTATLNKLTLKEIFHVMILNIGRCIIFESK